MCWTTPPPVIISHDIILDGTRKTETSPFDLSPSRPCSRLLCHCLISEVHSSYYVLRVIELVEEFFDRVHEAHSFKRMNHEAIESPLSVEYQACL